MLCLLVPFDLRPSTAHPTPARGPSRRLRFEHNQGNAEEPVKSASLAGPDMAVTRPQPPTWQVPLDGGSGRQQRARTESRIAWSCLPLASRTAGIGSRSTTMSFKVV